MFESHRINVMITPAPKLGGTGECHMVLATPVSVSCGGGGISASESLRLGLRVAALGLRVRVRSLSLDRVKRRNLEQRDCRRHAHAERVEDPRV